MSDPKPVLTVSDLAVSFQRTEKGEKIVTDVVRDVDRGVVAARVPFGAASGSVWVRVDGVDSPTRPFTMTTGTFPVGPHAISGTVTGPGGPVRTGLRASG